MKVTTESVLGVADAERVLQARDGVVLERSAGDGVFAQAEGPLEAYQRVVTLTPVSAGGQGRDGVRVRQTVEFRVGIPYFSALFALPLRRTVAPLLPVRLQPWWAPPQRLDRRAAEVLAILAALAVVIGYVGSLLSITMTYAAAEFGASRAAQGVALGVVRANVVLALAVLVLADRRGRRRLILGCAASAAVLTSLGALAPSLAWLAVTQILAVAGTAALLILVGVMAAEETPPGSRAWALALLTMAVGLGGGLDTALLPVAGLGRGDWRALYLGAVLFLPLVASTRRLPESRRWQRSQPGATVMTKEGAARDDGTATPAAGDVRGGGVRGSGIPGSGIPGGGIPGGGGSGSGVPGSGVPGGSGGERGSSVGRGGGGRLALLCAGAFLFSLFATPSGQFQNEYLRTERAFSATRIAGFSLVTGTMGGLGVLVGGRLADMRGRRLVTAIGAGGGIATTLALYFSGGWPLWAWGVADSVLGYAVAPALGVYGPELFPTAQRSQATGVVAAAYAAGGVVGLITAGGLAQHFGTFAPAFAVLAIGPALLVLLIVRAYPETARRPLEDLNPGDRGP